jgi:hypothetical protein
LIEFALDLLMPPQDLEVLASNIVDRLPSVLERLRKYDQQNGLLEIQCEHLESEITSVRSSMVNEQDKQEKIKKCIAEIKTMIGPRKKRLRDDGKNCICFSMDHWVTVIGRRE